MLFINFYEDHSNLKFSLSFCLHIYNIKNLLLNYNLQMNEFLKDRNVNR